MNIPRKHPDNPPGGSERHTRKDTGHIIIRLARRHTHDSGDLREVAKAEGFRQLLEFLQAEAHLPSERLIRHATPGEIRKDEEAVGQTAFVPIHSLTAYWRLDVRHSDDPESLRQRLARMEDEVGIAYLERTVSEAFSEIVGAGANPYFKDQCYLETGPLGIGARAAWSIPGCQGDGVRVIDLEAGWIFDHEDLPGPQLLYGDDGKADKYVDGDHGAAAMGVVGAVNNTMGIIGVAPGIASLNAVSHYDAQKKSGLHVADAIGAAASLLNKGDILFLEVQRWDDQGYIPTETDSADLQAIRAAVSKGIIVIEAAGNAQRNLDQWQDANGEHSLDTKARNHVDSGAILVGACGRLVLPDPGGFQGHKRQSDSNYGSRVDVYAWGEGLYTAGYGKIQGSSGSKNSYTANFGETSGATALIAGAAALVQSRYRFTHNGDSLDSRDMRQLLSNPATGTRQALKNGDPIGVMPDVSKIVAGPP